MISTRIATSGRVTWERVWWFSRRSDWISSAPEPLRTASPRIHIVRRWSLAARASAVTASRRSRRIVSPWFTRTDRSAARSWKRPLMSEPSGAAPLGRVRRR
ncbi:hypothetical protein ACTOXX_34725 [Streptomyces rubiginosohelvolus]|uniref:hypothetical protein n=1 Tax=Streptomyces rubiginosohelvolus TaxID=67362 RepID=UPI003F91054F